MITERVDERTVRSALALASRAPSIHNSQPWRWRYDTHTVHLHADPRQWLPVTDTGGRDLVLSCGAALHHLRIALAASGVTATITRLPSPNIPSHLATVTLRARDAAEAELGLAAAITRRRTDRRRYNDWPVPERFLYELQDRAAREGVVLRTVDEAGGHALVAAALQQAGTIQDATAGYQTETALWSGRTAGVDGIPAANLLADAAGTGDGLARTFAVGTVEQPAGEDGAVLLVLGTATDGTLSQLRAGEALSAVLLHATDLGLATCPLSQPLEVESTYRLIRDELLGGSLAPQVLVRIGWAPQPPLPETPRRPVDDIIEPIRR